jgi:serine/threonine protein kinase
MTVAQLERPGLTDEELGLAVCQKEPTRYVLEEVIKYPKHIEGYLDPRAIKPATCVGDELVQSLVFRARDLWTDKMVAVKQDFGKNGDAQTRKEAKIQNWLNRQEACKDAVVPVLRVEHLAVSRCLEPSAALVTPWVDEGSYADKVACEGNESDFKEVVSAAASVAGVLAVMHAARLIHRDVRPANVLKGGKLIDFATTLSLDGVRDPKDRPGVGGYMPNERIEGNVQTPAGDVFALTNTVFTMFKGRLPYVQMLGESYFRTGVSLPIKNLREKLPMFSADGIKVMEAGSDPNPDNRPTAAQFGKIMLAEL